MRTDSMSGPRPARPTPTRSALSSLLLLTGLVLLGMTAGALLASGVAALLRPGTDLTQLLRHPNRFPDAWTTIMLVQALSQVFSFLVPALFYWYVVDRQRWADFTPRPLARVNGLGLVILLVIGFMPLNGLIIQWNQEVQFPETLAPLEQWMRAKENELGELTKYLTTLTTPGRLALALVVIAVLPAFGEEVLFRGVLQRRFTDWTGGNPHLGIWLTAALFSAIHLQFYGFVPRLLLGALFGYLYVWAGTIWVPILAHFVNNGFTVFMVYLRQRQVVSLDIEDTQGVTLTAGLYSLLFCLGLLYYFRRINKVPAHDPQLGEGS